MNWGKITQALCQHLKAQHQMGVRWLLLTPTAALALKNTPAQNQPAQPAQSIANTPGNAGSLISRPTPVIPIDSTPNTAPSLASPQPVPPTQATSTNTKLNLQQQAQRAASLADLHSAFTNCQHCPLATSRQNVVFGMGNPKPSLFFLGEGPGADEDAQGQPFVGRSGRLLTGFIAALGLQREDVYITNMVKCRPPENRNPTAEEINTCAPILKRQLDFLKPALLVTLGNVPLKALKPNAGGITRERGNIFSYLGYQVLPTFHPSYLLRNPNAIERAWQDLRKAMQAAYPEF